MDRKHSGGAPVSDGRGGGQRYMAGGRNGVRGDRRPKERDGREQRIRGGRGRPDYRDGGSSSLMMKTPVILARQDKRAEAPTMLPPGPGGVSIMQRESSGSHLPSSPPISHPSTSSSSGGLFSPRGDPIPSPSGGHHQLHHAPLPVSQSKSHEDRGRNHRKQDGITSSPSSYTPLQPGMRGRVEGGGGHSRSNVTEHSIFHSQTNEMTHALKLIDRNLHWEDKGMEFLLEQSDYLVVGVLGKQGVGKSTLMSLLAGTRTGAPKPFMFRTQSKEVYESGGYHTAGVEMMVTAERVILLDSQPILSDTMLDQLCGNPNLVPRDMTPAYYLQLTSLQLAMFLYSVCHVVMVVVDSLDSPNVLFDFLWKAEQMKSSCLGPSMDASELPDKGPKEYFPQVAFLLNHASPDHFQPYSIRDVHIMLAEQFRGAKFCINGGISLFKSGVVPVGKGFPLRKGAKSNDDIDPADVSFHLLPTNQNATDNFSVYTAGKPENLDSNLNPVLKLLTSYTGHPSYTLVTEVLRNQIFSMPRPPIFRTSPQQQQQQLTEREWFDYARRIWMTLRKSDLISEYEQILQDASPN